MSLAPALESDQFIAKLRKTTLGLVFLTIFLDLVGFGMFIPLLANIARDFNATNAQAASLSTWFSVGTLLAVSFFGRFSDKFGRKPILLFTIALSCVTQFATGFATGFVFLVVARFIAGIASGNIGVAQATISDISTAEERGKSMIVIGLAFGAGFAVGPAIGGAVARFLPADQILFTISCVAAALNLINFILVWFKLPETHHNYASPKLKALIEKVIAAQKSPRQGIKNWKIDLRQILKSPGFPTLLLLNFLQVFGFIGVETILPVALRDAYFLDHKKIFDAFVLVGITVLAVNGGVTRRLLGKFGEIPTLNLGQLFLGLGIASIPFFAPHHNAVLGGLAILATGSALANPSLNALVSRLSPAQSQGFAFGVAQTIAALARISGPLAMGYFYDLFQGASSLYISALLIALSALLGLTVLTRVNKGLKT